MRAIQQTGGLIHSVSSGYIQRKVAQQAYEYEKGLQSGEYVKIGLNKYTDDDTDGPDVELHEHNEAWVETQIKALQDLKTTRNNPAVARTLKELEKGTRQGDNVMPLLVNCCREYATVGEMTTILRDVFGEWQEPGIL